MANTAAGGSRSRPDLVLQGFPNMGTDTTVDLTLTTVVAGLNSGKSTARTDAAAKTTALSKSSGGSQAGQLRTPTPVGPRHIPCTCTCAYYIVFLTL